MAVDLILRNAVVYGSAHSDAVAVAGGVIVAVGDGSELTRLATANTLVIDCGGRAVVPGIVDAHCHVFAAAAHRDGVDCRPAATPTIAAVLAALRAASPRPDGWIRGYGYDDSPLGLGRHLTRHDLDAVSASIPVRVEHRSGHACALNSAGLRGVRHSQGYPGNAGRNHRAR